MLTPVTEPLGYDFFLRALLASAIVGVVCAVIGSYMVLRGLAFMGDALAHSAFPGVVVAYLLKGPFYLGAAAAAVATAVAIGWVTRRGNLRGDTAIGVLFAGMFALGVFLFSLIPNYVGDLFGFLFGEVLGIGLADLLALVGLSLAVLAVVAILWKDLRSAGCRRLRPTRGGARLPLACSHRGHDRGFSAGGRHHPGRGHAGHPRCDRAAADAQLRTPVGGGCDDRRDRASRWPVRELLAECGERRHDRARRDRVVPCRASPTVADRTPQRGTRAGHLSGTWYDL